MGSKSRKKVERLPEKLLQIRLGLALSQTQMKEKLELDSTYKAIGRYENGEHEPSLPTLLRYAKLAGISTDILIDDTKDLPQKFLKAKKSS